MESSVESQPVAQPFAEEDLVQLRERCRQRLEEVVKTGELRILLAEKERMEQEVAIECEERGLKSSDSSQEILPCKAGDREPAGIIEKAPAATEKDNPLMEGDEPSQEIPPSCETSIPSLLQEYHLMQNIDTNIPSLLQEAIEATKSSPGIPPDTDHDILPMDMIQNPQVPSLLLERNCRPEVPSLLLPVTRSASHQSSAIVPQRPAGGIERVGAPPRQPRRKVQQESNISSEEAPVTKRKPPVPS